MRRAFPLTVFRQALAATAVMLLATTTTIAQENQQPSEGKKPAANAEQAKPADAAPAEQADAEQEEAIVLKVIEFKSMSVTDFLSAARLSGVVDQTAGYGRQPRLIRQQPPGSPQRLFLGTQPDSSVLFVRGPEKEVSKVEAFAKKLDVAPEERPETLQLENGKQARRLPQSEINEIRELLQSLGLNTSTSNFGETYYLVFEETEESDVKQIEQVLEKLRQDREKKEKPEGDAQQESLEAEEKSEEGAELETPAEEEKPEEGTEQATSDEEGNTAPEEDQ